MGAYKDMDKVFDCIFTRPYAEDDYTANDLVENLYFRLSRKMFEKQEEICHMATKDTIPMLKDNVITFMQNYLNTEFGWIRNYIICRMLISYRMSNVDLGFEGEWFLREEFSEEEWAEFNKIMNKYVWEDYCKYLGPEKSKEYFKRVNHPEFIPEE